MKTITDIYILRCITNLHAGSGDSNYGIVDKEVQRDPVDTFPIVHSTSLKGAFREQFDSLVEDKLLSQEDVESIFGTDNKAKNGTPEQFKAGQYFFYPAQLLFYPVRSNIRPFFYATSQGLIRKFMTALEDMGINTYENLETIFNPLLHLTTIPNKPLTFIKVFIDEYESTQAAISGELASGFFPEMITTDNLALFHDDDLKETCQRLPVVARNYLENGISANLWYEEFVPRESWFYFFVSRPKTSNLFEQGLKQVKHTSQIGGNASVGYGLCKLQRVKTTAGGSNEKS
ncbi:MAG: type III-B CRISPR module RAMP protein Cmr4 [Bacteroidota bacterium]